MRVRIRLFARLRDIAGAAELERAIDQGSTVRSIWRGLCNDFPELVPYEPSLSAAVNEDYARMDAPVRDGDDIAFLPPVSGGRGHPARRTTSRHEAPSRCSTS